MTFHFHDPLLTKSDVAGLLRCCERTIERLVKLSTFPPPQRFGKEALWFQSVVHRWLDQRRQEQQRWEPSGEEQSPLSKTAAEHSQPLVALAKPASRSRAKQRPGELASRPMLAVSAAERRHIERLAAADAR
jgi:predicted DNA-binding transcriptional regulator AlpA